MKITVLSDGGWGTALATLLCKNNHQVTLWGLFPDYIQEMQKSRENPRYLPNIKLPETLQLTSNLAEAMQNCQIAVLASPSQYMRGLLTKISQLNLKQHPIYVDIAKGIEIESLKRISQLVEEILGDVPYTVLSGPSHAEEVARSVPTAVVVAAKNPEYSKTVQKAFLNENFRVYTSDDIIGVEIGGAIKNVFAIAAGICDGMAFGDNTKAALMTRGIVEMARLGEALGGKAETFSGLSGIGDIIVTCMSQHSRNRHVGEELGRGRKLKQILNAMNGQVAEGVTTAKSAYMLAKKIKIDTPIINQVYAGLYQDKDPRKAVRELMTRDAKPEVE